MNSISPDIHPRDIIFISRYHERESFVSRDDARGRRVTVRFILARSPGI